LLQTTPHTHQHQRSLLLPLRDQCKSHLIRSLTHRQYQRIYYFRQPRPYADKARTTHEGTCTVFVLYRVQEPVSSPASSRSLMFVLIHSIPVQMMCPPSHSQ
jgi:hypothetical protein